MTVIYLFVWPASIQSISLVSLSIVVRSARKPYHMWPPPAYATPSLHALPVTHSCVRNLVSPPLSSVSCLPALFVLG